MKQFALFVFIVLASLQNTCAQSIATDLDKNVESFEKVWNTIRDSHWDPGKVGQQWIDAKNELLPKVKQAKDIEETRDIIMDLIDRLEQSHFGVIPADSADALEINEGGGNANVGITARLVDGEILVTGVRTGTSAQKLGVRPGWTIVKVRDRSMKKFIEKIKGVEHGPQRTETTIAIAMEQVLSGGNGSKVKVKFRDESNAVQQLNLLCTVPENAKLSKFGHLPPIQVIDETRTLDGNIGYYHFNAFFDPIRIMPGFRNAGRNKNHENGFIIDLRGNIGGIAAMTMGMAGEFVEKRNSIGVMTTKDGPLNFVTFPKPNPIQGPVVVLVDEATISSAEILAGGLQDIGKAKVFGSRSAGLALPSQVIRLPNGDAFQFAMADYKSASGKSLEKDGVMPDFPIKVTKQNLIEEGDPVLNAAVDWIKNSSNKDK